MGKIFDALEKANKQIGLKEPTGSLKNKIKRYRRSEKDNIVPLVGFKSLQQGHDLDLNLVAFHNPQSVEAELFKVLRTNLLFPANSKPSKCIMVTSAVPGEGKSVVSANLSISIAQGIEEHVLLIDADIRNPTQYKYFGMAQSRGLSEYLATGSDVSKYFAKTPVANVTLLPAGAPPTNPTELLTTQKMKALLNEVSQRYDDRYIIIDSAPPSLAPETAAIANYMDAVLIVVKAGKTPRSAVTEVIEQIGKEKILGIVLNHSDQSMKKYYGYGKSYYKPK